MSSRKVIREAVLAAFCVVTTPVFAQPAADLNPDDRAAIQALVASYARALADCRADDFAALFVPETGYFASGFTRHNDQIYEKVAPGEWRVKSSVYVSETR
jgi:hypothetical protein